MRAEWLLIGVLTLSLLTGVPKQVQGGPEGDGDETDSLLMREAAARRISWRAEGPIEERDRFGLVKILAINDFHGQLLGGSRTGGRPVGGAAVLVSYLKKAQSTPPDVNVTESTVIVHAGDHVGASAPESSFFQDEPSITFLNLLANQHCSYVDRMNPQCNMVGTLGNHEFDEGQGEMLRLINGGTHRSGPFFEDPYRGVRFPYVSANVVDKTNGQPILPPFVIKEIDGVRLAFIGAVLKETPTIVTSTGVDGLVFLEEAESVNRYVGQLRQGEGIHTFVVLIHQGGRQTSYAGPTQPGVIMTGQEITRIIEHLDDDVDVVVSGHSHAFTNALVKNRNGKDILVTQALSYGTAYADIRLMIDRSNGEVFEKSAAVVSTYADEGPGLMPDPTVKQLVSLAQQKVAPLVTRVIGQAAADITRAENEAGESALGNLIADAQRATLKTDFAFMNPGGIRTDVSAGPVTYRDLFTVQPFGNSLVRMTLAGSQIYELLNQQWLNQPQRILKVSGLTYTWDSSRPVGDRVIEVRQNGMPIDRAASYSVTTNDFLAAGGDNFSVFLKGENQRGGPIDLKVLISYLEGFSRPFAASIEGRITRVN
ncbi:MAG TPA: bifunctional metallophosphatase/5'-nucleotidase [Nitrospira sp.]|nr:bifunctional metallophosphatase/5'-nucleotidase [Nitrospira sp.]